MSYRVNQWHEVPPGCCSLCEHGEHHFGHCKRCPRGSTCNALAIGYGHWVPGGLYVGLYLAVVVERCARSPDAQATGAVLGMWAVGLFATVAAVFGLVRAAAYIWQRSGPVARAIRESERSVLRHRRARSSLRLAQDERLGEREEAYVRVADSLADHEVDADESALERGGQRQGQGLEQGQGQGV